MILLRYVRQKNEWKYKNEKPSSKEGLGKRGREGRGESRKREKLGERRGNRVTTKKTERGLKETRE